MRLLLLAVLSVLVPAAHAAEVTVKTKTPAAAVAALVRFTAPKGWTSSDYANSGGADPVVRFETRRYCDNPLIVQGPGAGPQVTAGGVFGDLLRLCAYRGAPI